MGGGAGAGREAPELQAVHVEVEQRAVHIEEMVGDRRDPFPECLNSTCIHVLLACACSMCIGRVRGA